MAIELTEKLLSPAEASRHAPGRPHVSTIWRWMTRGCRGIRLESLVCAGRRFTSVEAIERFIAATTAAADGTSVPVRSPRRRERDIAAAEAELGIHHAPHGRLKPAGGGT